VECVAINISIGSDGAWREWSALRDLVNPTNVLRIVDGSTRPPSSAEQRAEGKTCSCRHDGRRAHAPTALPRFSVVVFIAVALELLDHRTKRWMYCGLGMHPGGQFEVLNVW
jgi:hypothetical protein